MKNSVRNQLRQSAANMVGFKNVFENSSKICPRRFVCVNLHCAEFEVQRTNVVETKYVIHMTMRDQHGVEKFDIGF